MGSLVMVSFSQSAMYVKNEFLNTTADVNECLNNPCEQLCENTDGSFVCSCSDGYTVNGRMCDGKYWCIVLLQASICPSQMLMNA